MCYSFCNLIRISKIRFFFSKLKNFNPYPKIEEENKNDQNIEDFKDRALASLGLLYGLPKLIESVQDDLESFSSEKIKLILLYIRKLRENKPQLKKKDLDEIYANLEIDSNNDYPPSEFMRLIFNTFNRNQEIVFNRSELPSFYEEKQDEIGLETLDNIYNEFCEHFQNNYLKKCYVLATILQFTLNVGIKNAIKNYQSLWIVKGN